MGWGSPEVKHIMPKVGHHISTFKEKDAMEIHQPHQNQTSDPYHLSG